MCHRKSGKICWIKAYIGCRLRSYVTCVRVGRDRQNDSNPSPDVNKHGTCGRDFLSRGNTAGAKFPLGGRASRDIG